MPSPLEAALDYASRGWPVFPVWEPTEGRCACGVAACPTPAKHARNQTGPAGATATDYDQIRRWWTGFPDAGIAIKTGGALFVVDVAPAGAKRFADLQTQHGAFPTTMEAISGAGGRHFYFQNISGFRPTPDLLGPGITLYGDGSYIIAPPSKHVNGETYRWSDGKGPGVALAALPAWFVEEERVRLDALVIEAHKTIPVVKGPSHGDQQQAALLYNQHNSMRRGPWLPFPTVPGPCPLCPSPNSFRAHPSVEDKWMCSSPHHTKGGTRKGGIWVGDVLDIDATQRGLTRHKHLKNEGFLGKGNRGMATVTPLNPSRAVVNGDAPQGEPATVEHPFVPQTRSFASLCMILETPTSAQIALNGRTLQFNMMSGRPCLDRQNITKFEIYDIRRRVESWFTDDKDAGLAFGNEDVRNALDLVAYQNKFYPVREYLDGLKWDGTSRIEMLVHNIMHIENNYLNRALVFRWLISAVARARIPGCQCDSMIVLYGPEGIRKSSFFRVLGGEWYASTMMDPRHKDALHQIRAVWLYEWQEMDALSRARDSEAVKAFLTDRTDHYRPSHEPDVEDVPRNGVFCGTTNLETFLTELTGDRRFWPITCLFMIDTDLLAQHRDQIWAEAAAAHAAGEPWHLTEEEKALLAPVHDRHRHSDPWEGVVMRYVRKCLDTGEPIYVQGILLKALSMPPKEWTTEDKRIAKILRRYGMNPGPKKRLGDGTPVRLWIAPETLRSTLDAVEPDQVSANENADV